MSSSLIPERPLLISPSLAATIGLEEACMLSILGDLATFLPLSHANGRQWLDVDANWVGRMMPFWTDHDIQRISRNLKDKGILLLASAPYTESQRLTLAFEEPGTRPPPYAYPIATNPAPSIHTGATLISPNWQPDQELLRQIYQYNIPLDFVYLQVPEFVAYWRERGESSHSWGAKFLKDLIYKWRNHQTNEARRNKEAANFNSDSIEVMMSRDWHPSTLALETLQQKGGINLAFVEDAIPEFILYWSGKIETQRVWNSKFYNHVKIQWERYKSASIYDPMPKRIPLDWTPSGDVLDLLKMANIDIGFAMQQVPEFLLFWKESNRLNSSWGTKFLQHVKRQWAITHSLVNSQQVN